MNEDFKAVMSLCLMMIVITICLGTIFLMSRLCQ